MQLLSCPNNGYGIENCGHYQDMTVSCIKIPAMNSKLYSIIIVAYICLEDTRSTKINEFLKNVMHEWRN